LIIPLCLRLKLLQDCVVIHNGRVSLTTLFSSSTKGRFRVLLSPHDEGTRTIEKEKVIRERTTDANAKIIIP
jgi:hypothetical protein